MNPEIEHRSAQLGEVSFPKRTIELIVMPYERETNVAYHGRMITEVCSRGAFDGVQQRTSQIRVNLDHDRRRPVGRTIGLYPSREEGLVAEIRVSRIDEGERALVMADDGLLDASAGFAPLPNKPDAEVWETRSYRRLNHLYLDHIALVPDPAYPDARVLAVRNAQLAEAAERALTPNLDRLEVEAMRQLYADIDRRYGLAR